MQLISPFICISKMFHGLFVVLFQDQYLFCYTAIIEALLKNPGKKSSSDRNPLLDGALPNLPA